MTGSHIPSVLSVLLATIAAQLEAGDRARENPQPDAPFEYAERAADLVLACAHRAETLEATLAAVEAPTLAALAEAYTHRRPTDAEAAERTAARARMAAEQREHADRMRALEARYVAAYRDLAGAVERGERPRDADASLGQGVSDNAAAAAAGLTPEQLDELREWWG